ncbi:DUF1796 family putative cysteine peptidase [Paracoccus niistensis]|uniref:DUF1796 family putative cysteine peptidase n=1 Tax=Paracoccus niistensis TaxID=632935 RepID=A0ABV6I395_9RHOB
MGNGLEPKVEFYSIGENCLGHDVLKRHGVDVQVTPFSHGRSNIDFISQLVDTGFQEMLEPEFLKYEIIYNKRVAVDFHLELTRVGA